MKLRRTVIMTAILAVVLTSVAIPMTATASTTPPVQTSAPQPTGWPKAYNEKASSLVAFDNDKVATINCASSGTSNVMTFTNYGTTSPVTSVVPPTSVSKSICYDYGVNNATSSYAVSSDGSMYTGQNPSSNHFDVAKFKNGRQIWATPALTSATNCAPYGGTSTDLIMRSMSIGPDGNLYGTLTSTGSPSACGDWLVGFNSENGNELFRVHLQTSSYNGITPRVWTYTSTILVMDSSGMIREFNYSGVENTSKQYTFTPPSGTYLDGIYTVANADKRVFAVFTTLGAPTATKVAFHDSDGTNGVMSTSFYSSYPGLRWYIGADGELVGTMGSYIYHFDIASNASSTYGMTLPSGYTNQVLTNYSEDSDGVMVLTRQIWISGTSYSNVIRVDTIDPTTSVLTNVFSLEGSTTHSFNPSYFVGTVHGNYLYATICYSDSTCTGDPSTQDLSLYKVALTGTGDILSDANAQYGTYESTDRNYVAMGDSFSSGEGLDSFIYGSDNSGSDECHRSSQSYPSVLDQTAGLDLNLTAFVACSGATTDNILFGGTGTGAWNESPQLNSINSSTKVVTLTIGGNDAGFSTVAGACIQSIQVGAPAGFGCSTDVTVTSPLAARLKGLAGTATSTQYTPDATPREIYALKDVLAAIAFLAPDAEIYIAGYPHLFGSSESDFSNSAEAPSGKACFVGYWVGTLSVDYDDAQWINTQADNLNGIIKDAVDYSTDHGLDVTYVPPTFFDTHGLCDSSDSWIRGAILSGATSNPDVNPGSLHPDSDGAEIGYGTMFNSQITSHL